MDITLIVPYSEGDIEPDCIRIYPGKLTLTQLVALTNEEAYPRKAILEWYNEDGTLDGIRVTFNNDPDDPDAEGPDSLREHYESGALCCTGYEFTNDHSGCGHMSYRTLYSKLSELPEALKLPGT